MVKTSIRLYPKKGFYPSLKIYRGDFIHLVKKGRGDFILVAKNMGGIISTYTKMTRGDSIRGGFCPYPTNLIGNYLFKRVDETVFLDS